MPGYTWVTARTSGFEITLQVLGSSPTVTQAGEALHRPGDLRSGPIEFEHGSARVNQQRFASRSEHHAVALTLKQLNPDVFFQ